MNRNWNWKLAIFGQVPKGTKLTRANEFYLSPRPLVYSTLYEGSFIASGKESAWWKAVKEYKSLFEDKLIGRIWWDQEPTEIGNGYYLNNSVSPLDWHSPRFKLVFIKERGGNIELKNGVIV